MPDTKTLEKCGTLAIFAMLFSGTIFGILGVVLAHYLIAYYEDYYLILVFPILMALLLGFGFSIGARMGRCTRLKLGAALVVLIFSIICYGLFLFLNNYYDTQNPKPATVLEEYSLIARDVQNLLGKIPYLSQYIPVAEDTPTGNIGTTLVDFAKTLPELAQTTPVVIGTIFDLALLVPVKGYLVYPGVTTWDPDGGYLAFDTVVKRWMLWIPEFLLVFLIALLMTRGGTKEAYRKQQERLKKAGFSPTTTGTPKAPKEKQGRFKRKKKAKEEPVAPRLDLAPHVSSHEEETTQPEPTPKKKKFPFFGRKKKAKVPPEKEQTPPPEPTAEQQAAEVAETADKKLAMEFPEDQQDIRYALILHQYEPSRQEDLIRLIQQVGQVSEDQARRLLKVPSRIKEDVSAQDAKLAIEKFQQVQAQVKLITMEQLLAYKKKRQQAAAQRASSAAPQPSSAPEAEESYALILRGFGSAQQKPVLELLSSLSGAPVDELQQSLTPPVSILRDATKDEVTMIAQQFKNLQADVIILTMAKLRKLMAKK